MYMNIWMDGKLFHKLGWDSTITVFKFTQSDEMPGFMNIMGDQICITFIVTVYM